MLRPHALLLTLAPALACAPADATRRTNVVLIVIDTLRADVAREAATPNMDRLARDGVAFERAFSHAPMTLPAHTALFSSRLPGETGVTNNGQRVPRDLALLGTWLADAGWHAEAATSLATLWSVERGAGLDRGFDAWTRGPYEISSGQAANATLRTHLADEREAGGLLLFAHYAEPHEPYAAHGSTRNETRILLDGRELERVDAAAGVRLERRLELPPGTHTLAVESDAPIRVRSCRLRDARGTPLVETSSEPTTHEHLTFHVEEAGPFELSAWLHDVPNRSDLRARYQREVEAADRALGALLEDLDASGLYDSSLIVLTSDHGEGLGEHGVVGHVRHLYDELLHVPLVVKLPEGDPRRADLSLQTRTLVRHVDLLPTLAEALSLRPPPDARGISLFEAAPRTLVAETRPPEAPRHLICLRDDAFKLIYDPAAERFELYDLVDDPAEERDVFATRADARPGWPAHLRGLATRDTARAGFAAESAGWLRALGYVGD